jgi:predicted secreted protein
MTYTASQAIEAQGTQLLVQTGASPDNYERICEIKTFTGPGGSASVIDVTNLCSTAKEKRMGLADEGQLSFTINYVPTDTSHMALRSYRESREKVAFRIVFNDGSPGTQWDFEAFVLGFAVSGAVDAVIEANVTLEITGSITES